MFVFSLTPFICNSIIVPNLWQVLTFILPLLSCFSSQLVWFSNREQNTLTERGEYRCPCRENLSLKQITLCLSREQRRLRSIWDHCVDKERELRQNRVYIIALFFHCWREQLSFSTTGENSWVFPLLERTAEFFHCWREQLSSSTTWKNSCVLALLDRTAVFFHCPWLCSAPSPGCVGLTD